MSAATALRKLAQLRIALERELARQDASGAVAAKPATPARLLKRAEKLEASVRRRRRGDG